jgi:hypothetical protein
VKSFPALSAMSHMALVEGHLSGNLSFTQERVIALFLEVMIKMEAAAQFR